MANSPQGSGFTNIQNILSANQNNKLGSAVGGGVINAANQAKQGLGQAEQQFQQGTQQGAQGIQNAYQNVNQVLQNPTGASDQDVANFSQYRSGQYGGPKDLGDVTSLQNQARNAQQLGQAGQTEGGRIALLQRFAGAGPNYTSGQQKLDNLLLGQQANNNLSQARRVSSGLENQVNQAQQGAQQVGATMQGKAQNLATDVNNQIQGQQNPLLSTLSQRATQAQSDKDAAMQRIQQGLASGSLSAADAQQLGLQAGMNIGSIDLSQFLTEDPTKATQQNVATSDEAAKLNALAKLGGQNAFGDVTQAGTFGQNQFKYDVNALNQDITNQQAAYQQGANPINTALANDRDATNRVLNTIFQQGPGMPGMGGLSPYAATQQKLQQDTGINFQNNPNAVQQLAQYYQNQSSNPTASNWGKSFREGTLGQLGGSDRDALIAALSDMTKQQGQLSDLQKQFGIGKTLQVT